MKYQVSRVHDTTLDLELHWKSLRGEGFPAFDHILYGLPHCLAEVLVIKNVLEALFGS